jgi:hypothetical protein
MPDVEDSAIIVDAWTVEDGNQTEFLDALEGLFGRLRELEGFLEGAIFKGIDATRFVSWARMRSSRERDAALIDSEVRSRMRGIRGLAHPDLGAYTAYRTFSPPEF